MIQTAYQSRSAAFRRGTVRPSRAHRPLPFRKGLVLNLASPRRRPANVWSDSSPRRNHAALVNMDPTTDWLVEPSTGWVLETDEVNDHVLVPDFAYGPYFTVAFWYRLTDNLGNFFQYVFSHGAFNVFNSLNVFFGEVGSATPNLLRTVFRDNNDVAANIDVMGATVGWHHYGFTVDANTGANVYLDGVWQASNAVAGGDPFNPVTDIYWGAREDLDALRMFGGRLADLSIHDRALTRHEMWKLSRRRTDPLGVMPPLTGPRLNRLTTYLEPRTMAIDLSNDFASLDGLEDITLNTVVVQNVLREYSAVKEGDASEGAYLHRDTVFQLPTVPVVAPVVGDVIVADGVSFKIQKVRRPFAGDYWGCTCRGLAITTDADLKDTVTLYPAARTILPGGGTKTTHTAASGTFQNVAAKIQIRPAKIEERAGKRDFVEQYEVFVAMDIVDQIDAGAVLKDQDGKQYAIVSWENRQRIDELSSIFCEIPVGT